MSTECHNSLYLSGDQTQIDEFLNLITYRDKHYKETGWITDYIDCRGFVSKSKASKNREVIDFIKREVSENKIIGWDYEIDGCRLDFTTRNQPYVKPLLYISNLFPLVYFELPYLVDDYDYDGRYEFINGNLLTEYYLARMNREWNLHIYKTKYKTVDGFKQNYGLNRLRNITVKIHEETRY